MKNANGRGGHGSMGADIFRDLCHRSSIWELVSSLVAVSRSKQAERGLFEQCFFFLFFFFLCPRCNIERCSPTPLFRCLVHNDNEPLDGYRSRRGEWEVLAPTKPLQACLNTKQKHLQWLWKDRCSILRFCCLGYVTDQATSWLEADGRSSKLLPFNGLVENVNIAIKTW